MTRQLSSIGVVVACLVASAPLAARAQDGTLPSGNSGVTGSGYSGEISFTPTSDPKVWKANGVLLQSKGDVKLDTTATLSGNVLTYTIDEKVTSFVAVLEHKGPDDYVHTYTLTLPDKTSPAGTWTVAGATQHAGKDDLAPQVPGWAAAPVKGGIEWQSLTRKPEPTPGEDPVVARAMTLPLETTEAARDQAQARFGVRPKRWLGYLQPPSGDSVSKAVSAAVAATGNRIAPSWLYAVAIGEGLNLYLDQQKNGDTPPLDGFQYLGVDTFGTRAAALRKAGYLPKDFVEGKDYTVSKNTNEKNETVTSPTFATLPGGLTALASMLEESRDRVLAESKKIWGPNVHLTEDEIRFWSYFDFNVGPGGARTFMEKHPPTWGDSRQGTERVDQHEGKYNSILRVATASWLDDLGVFKATPNATPAPATSAPNAPVTPPNPSNPAMNQPLGGD